MPISTESTLVDTTKTIAETLATHFQHDFKTFAEYIFCDEPSIGFTVPTKDKKIIGTVPAFQSEIMGILQDLQTTRSVILSSPRGFAKSTTCSIFFPIYTALMQKFRSIVVISNSEDLAIDFLRQIRLNLESNMRIQQLWGDQRSEKWTETHLILKNGVNIRAKGIGGQIRGFRPDLVILDDIENNELVKSEDRRRELKSWIETEVMGSLTTDGCILFVGTLISRVSVLWEYLHNAGEAWTKRFYQCYRDGVQEAGHELWPSEKPHSWLQWKKSQVGTNAFSREYMNDPLPEEGERFDTRKLRFFEDRDLEGKQLGMYVTIDPAFSEESTADYGVILQCLHDGSDNLYVDTYFRQRVKARRLIEQFMQMFQQNKHRIRSVGVEKNGPQKVFYEQLVYECNRVKLYPPFHELKATVNSIRNKVDRCTFAIQPRLEAGKIFVRPNHQELIEEMMLFAPDCKHDDLIDALAYMYEIVEQYPDYSIDYQSFSFENELEQPVMQGYGLNYG